MRNQRNGAGGPAMGNRRGDVTKGGPDRRGGGMTGRYPTQAHSVSSPQNRAMSGNKYEARGRPSAQELQDSFNEFSISKEGNPRKEPAQGQTIKTYENKSQSQSSKILLEPRASASPRTTPTDTKQQPQAGAAARRADGLRGWNQEFNNNYRPEGKADTPRESPARTVPAVPSSNAWARGPPTSVTNVHNSSQQEGWGASRALQSTAEQLDGRINFFMMQLCREPVEKIP
ncbi:hypothetical protein GCK32_014855 [Trichostrongylus colubriformis]|uniref:Uncharacterized protein n=1 Tax=Trichostrongylus colubriformis TaxID=6319 RepID=A0AAN8F721_TRICO